LIVSSLIISRRDAKKQIFSMQPSRKGENGESQNPVAGNRSGCGTPSHQSGGRRATQVLSSLLLLPPLLEKIIMMSFYESLFYLSSRDHIIPTPREENFRAHHSASPLSLSHIFPTGENRISSRRLLS
jgi:hypothetical protein